MMSFRKVMTRASAALSIALTCSFALSGCGKGESSASKEPESWKPESYMKDEAFTGKLKAAKAERQDLMKRYAEAKEAYDRALAADPKGEKAETKDLKAKMDSIATAYQANRKETMKTVRERLTPPKASVPGAKK